MSSEMTAGLPEIWVETLLWAKENGAPLPLDSQPGVWSGKLEHFIVSINGHDEPLKDQHGVELPRFGISIVAPDYLGAVLLVGPDGGVGVQGMEEDVLAAIRKALNPSDTEVGG